jgi:hypothetical protein
VTPPHTTTQLAIIKPNKSTMSRQSHLQLLLSILLTTANGFAPPTRLHHATVPPPSLSQPTQTSYARTKADYDDIEFFDLDDDDQDLDYEEDDYEPTTYNGIIPNPLLDAMDPDGVYERLGPELFSDWTFWRDAALFCVFLALFTKDTHHYGHFDSVIEGLENLPVDFVRENIDSFKGLVGN